MMRTTESNRGELGLRAWATIIAALYSASPVDAVPDIIPLLGYADDGGVILLAIVLIVLVTLSKRGAKHGESQKGLGASD